MATKSLATSQRPWDSFPRGARRLCWTPAPQWFRGSLPALFVTGRILEFHTNSPPKILQNSSSADQGGEVELFLAQSIKYRFQTHTRHTRHFFTTEPHYNRFFPTSIFLGVFTSGKYQASNPWGTSDEDPDPKPTEVCLLLPRGFPSHLTTPLLLSHRLENALSNPWFVYSQTKTKKKEVDMYFGPLLDLLHYSSSV